MKKYEISNYAREECNLGKKRKKKKSVLPRSLNK